MQTSANIEGNPTIPTTASADSAARTPQGLPAAIAQLISEPVQLIDHRAVDWPQAAAARYWMEQTFEYTYPGPIRNLQQRLITIPPDEYGDQRVLAYAMQATSPLAVQSTSQDTFGNRIIRFTVPQVEERIAFEMKLVIERDFTRASAPRVTASDAKTFFAPTSLTQANAQIQELAQRFLGETNTVESFGHALNSWIYSTMRYRRGATTVHTTAAEALALAQGLCQDYAHIMLAIARAAGIAARYVSGHLLGEGRSHAWIELMEPLHDGDYCALAFDPTNHRRTTPAYLTIAVGRDYNDVSPTAGTFTAPYPGQLHAIKRAGVTHVARRSRS